MCPYKVCPRHNVSARVETLADTISLQADSSVAVPAGAPADFDMRANHVISGQAPDVSRACQRKSCRVHGGLSGLSTHAARSASGA